jgi:hypothetical protein
VTGEEEMLAKASESSSDSPTRAEEREFAARGFMRVPTPADEAFVERVTRELAQAHERCLQLLLMRTEP